MSKISYYTKLSGTSFRQDVIAKLKPGKTKLRIVAQKDNEYDEYACEVQAYLDKEWTQIGWIQKGKNQDIHEYITNGGLVDIVCSDITGDTVEGHTLGVNVGITYGENDSETKGVLTPVKYGDAEYILFDEAEHRAYTVDGDPLISCSQVEKKYTPEFNPEYPARALAKSSGAKKDDIILCWDNHRELASEYGTLIHKALQYYYETSSVTKKIDKNKERDHSAAYWMPHEIAAIVDAFIKTSGITETETEVRVKYGDVTGIIDSLQKTTRGGYIINDYKVTRKIKDVKFKKYGEQKKYTIQQNCYRQILESLGHKVEGMYLWQWDGEKWTKHEVKRIKI